MSLTTSPLTMNRFSGKCGSLNFSQPYRPPKPVTGIVLILFYSCKNWPIKFAITAGPILMAVKDKFISIL
jgi:hypothetical protein